MTDIRAMLEQEAQRRSRLDRLYKKAAKVMFALTVVAAVILLLRHPSFGDLVENLAPALALAGFAAGYTPRHRAALKAAITDPDPALDVHFARALASYDTPVFELGREAFTERFRERLPELGPEEWRTVALALPRTRGDVTARFLSLLRAGGGVSAIEATEAFANLTKSDRLRTAAREALGEMRLRAAREAVEERSRSVTAGTEDEKARLGLSV